MDTTGRNVLLFNVEVRYTPLQYFFVATTGIEPMTTTISLSSRCHFSMSHVKETKQNMRAIITLNVPITVTFWNRTKPHEPYSNSFAVRFLTIFDKSKYFFSKNSYFLILMQRY